MFPEKNITKSQVGWMDHIMFGRPLKRSWRLQQTNPDSYRCWIWGTGKWWLLVTKLLFQGFIFRFHVSFRGYSCPFCGSKMVRCHPFKKCPVFDGICIHVLISKKMYLPRTQLTSCFGGWPLAFMAQMFQNMGHLGSSVYIYIYQDPSYHKMRPCVLAESYCWKRYLHCVLPSKRWYSDFTRSQRMYQGVTSQNRVAMKHFRSLQ